MCSKRFSERHQSRPLAILKLRNIMRRASSRAAYAYHLVGGEQLCFLGYRHVGVARCSGRDAVGALPLNIHGRLPIKRWHRL